MIDCLLFYKIIEILASRPLKKKRLQNLSCIADGHLKACIQKCKTFSQYLCYTTGDLNLKKIMKNKRTGHRFCLSLFQKK